MSDISESLRSSYSQPSNLLGEVKSHLQLQDLTISRLKDSLRNKSSTYQNDVLHLQRENLKLLSKAQKHRKSVEALSKQLSLQRSNLQQKEMIFESLSERNQELTEQNNQIRRVNQEYQEKIKKLRSKIMVYLNQSLNSY